MEASMPRYFDKATQTLFVTKNAGDTDKLSKNALVEVNENPDHKLRRHNAELPVQTGCLPYFFSETNHSVVQAANLDLKHEDNQDLTPISTIINC